MKPNLASLMVILVAALMCASESANAFYDPGLQRWVNRDLGLTRLDGHLGEGMRMGLF